MKLSEKLLVIAEWLESEDNDIITSCNDECLEVIAETLVKAASIIREGAEDVSNFDAEEPVLTQEKLDEFAAVAEAFDQSGDELLQKQASVIDEILLTISSPKNYLFNFKKAEDARLEDLKKKYNGNKEKQEDLNKISDAVKDIKDSGMLERKKNRPLEHALTTRYCPDHSGAQITRISENTFQCSLDGKTYNYEEGFTDMQGRIIPGTSVQEQTKMNYPAPEVMFSSRK